MPIAERLKGGETNIADNFAEVTVMFADIVGFTRLSAKGTPRETLVLLNELFTRFDKSAQRIGVEKIKTIGDAYMAVAGLPTPDPDHARRIVDLALEVLGHVKQFREEIGSELSVRIGINSGPVVAGVIGSSKFIYDLWGDTVNIASRMESSGEVGRVNISESTYMLLREIAGLHFTSRGKVHAKGKGDLEMYFVERG